MSTSESSELPSLSGRAVLGLIIGLIQFPRPQICRHAVAADLLSALEAEGLAVTRELADAIVGCDDDQALELLTALRGPA